MGVVPTEEVLHHGREGGRTREDHADPATNHSRDLGEDNLVPHGVSDIA